MEPTEPAEPIEAETPRFGLGPALMAAGGVAGAIGPLLQWTTISVGRIRLGLDAKPGGGRLPFPGRGSAAGKISGRLQPKRLSSHLGISGLHTPAGRFIFALSVALVVLGVIGWLAWRFWVRLGSVAVGLVLGVVVFAMAAVDLASPSGVRGAVRVGPSASSGLGVYVALAGGAVAAIAATAWLVATRSWWAGRPPASRFAPPAGPQPATPSPAEPAPAGG